MLLVMRMAKYYIYPGSRRRKPAFKKNHIMGLHRAVCTILCHFILYIDVCGMAHEGIWWPAARE